jgi:hypothetical protein
MRERSKGRMLVALGVLHHHKVAVRRLLVRHP